MTQTPWIDIRDHAFGSGPVFRRPKTVLHAVKAARSLHGARLLRQVWLQFDRNAIVDDTVHLGATARLVNRGGREGVRIGADCALRGTFRLEASGRLDIGASVYVGDACVVSVFDSVVIGEGTLVAHGVQIFDNDSHPVDAADRMADFRKKLGHKLPRPIHIARAPIRIGRRCWLGMNALVMKGVTIGDDTIVAAGSVVVKDLPSGVVAAGNPACPVRTLSSLEEVVPDLSASSKVVIS